MDQVQIPPEIKSYLENLIKDANLVTTDDLKEEMINQLFQRLDSYLTSVIVQNMPAEHLDEFVKLNEEQKSREEIEKFITDNMPNAQDVFTKAFADFREMYLSSVTKTNDNTAQEQ